MKKKVFLSFAALTAAFTMNAQSKLPRFNEPVEISKPQEFVLPAKTRSVSATGHYSAYYKANHDTHADEINALLTAQGGLQVQTGATTYGPLVLAKNSLRSYEVKARTYPTGVGHPKDGQTYWNKAVQGLPITSPVTLTQVGFYAQATNGGTSNILVSVYDKTFSNKLAETTVSVSSFAYKTAVFSTPVATSDSLLVVFEMTAANNQFGLGYTYSYFKSLPKFDLSAFYTGVTNTAFDYNATIPFAGDGLIFSSTPNTPGANGSSLEYLLREKFDFFVYPYFNYDLNMPYTASKSTICAGDSVTFSTPANNLALNPIFNFMEWNKIVNGVEPAYSYITTSKGDTIFENKFSGKVGFPTVGSFAVKAKGIIAPWSTADFLEDSTVINITVGKTAGTLTGANAVCSGSTTTFTPSVAGGSWLVSAGTASASVVNGVVTGKNTAGTATIRYSITGAGAGCASLVTKTITVNARPSAGTLTGANYVCRNSSVKLTPSVAGGTWTSLKPSIASVDAQGNVTGLRRTSFVTGVVSYTVTNASGCSASVVRGLGIDSLPVVPIISGPAKICSNGTAFFRTTNTAGVLWTAGPYLTASSAFQGVFTHRTNTNGAVPSDNFNTSVKATSYSVNKVCTSEATKAVQLRTIASKTITITAANSLVVNANTPVSVTLPSGLTTTNTSSRFWISSASTDMSVVSTANLSTTVKALKVPTVAPKLYFNLTETSTGCGITANKSFAVTASQSIVDANNDVNTTIGVNVYPNPSNGVVTFENIAGANAISLVDMTGRTVKTVAVNADRMTVDFSGVQNGKYLVQVAGENVNEVRSIVIE